jgi:hypothetical protein
LVPNALPVSLTAATGCTTRLLYTRLFGVVNCSMPSRKNGRFSWKNRSSLGSNSSCPASDSIWLKSGLAVPVMLRLLVMPHRAVPPSSGLPPL